MNAGVRAISFHAELLDDVTRHLEQFPAPGRDGQRRQEDEQPVARHKVRVDGPTIEGRAVFVGPQGGQLRRSNFRDGWVSARKAAGVTSELHFHDLRHTGNTLASTAGAST